MASAFPTNLPGAKVNFDSATAVSSTEQNAQGEDINALGAKVGKDSSAVTTSHDYKLSGVTGSDKAVSKTGSEILTNKTLTSPAITNGTFTGGGALLSKITDSTRVLTAASGDVAYTGVGFVPSSIRCYAVVADAAGPWSIGDSDSNGGAIYMFKRLDNSNFNAESTGLVFLLTSTSNQQKAVVKSYDADGFTLTWTKTGSPTGTGKLKFICYR